MYPSRKEFLQHISDECQFIINETSSKSDEDIFLDQVLLRALVRSIEKSLEKQAKESIKIFVN
jgi:hypothetical protein